MAEDYKAIYESSADEKLMTAIHHGDVEAFNVLYKRYNNRLKYYFYRMLGNSCEKAMDFVQDIFIKIIEKPELFDTGRKFSTWIFSVAHNMCKNEYRKMSVRSNMVYAENIDLFSDTDYSENETRITADQIYELIGDLEESDKTAFILYYREEFSLQEIGKILEVPEGTVKSKLFYARKKIGRKLLVDQL